MEKGPHHRWRSEGGLYKFRIHDKYYKYLISNDLTKNSPFFDLIAKIRDQCIIKITENGSIFDYLSVNIEPCQIILDFYPFCEKDLSSSQDDNISFINNNKYGITQCNICDMDFNGNTVIMLNCYHAYCKSCLIEYKEYQCPHCREKRQDNADILYEVNNFKDNIQYEKYVYKLIYNKKSDEYTLYVSKEKVITNTILWDGIGCSEYILSLPVFNHDPSPLLSDINDYKYDTRSLHPECALETLNQSTLSNFLGLPHINISSGLLNNKMHFAPTENEIPCDMIDGIILCLSLRWSATEGGGLHQSATEGGVLRTTIPNISLAQLILSIKSICIYYSHNKLHQINSFQLLEYFLNSTPKNKRDIINITNDKFIFDIDWKLLFGIEKEEDMQCITYCAVRHGHFGLAFNISVNEDIFSHVKYKIKTLTYIEPISKQLVKDYVKRIDNNHQIPFISGNSILEELNSTSFEMHNNNLIIQKIYIVSNKEIHDITIKFTNKDVFFYEDFMCLRYYEKGLYFYVLPVKASYDASILQKEYLHLNLYNKKEKRDIKIYYGNSHTNTLTILPNGMMAITFVS